MVRDYNVSALLTNLNQQQEHPGLVRKNTIIPAIMRTEIPILINSHFLCIIISASYKPNIYYPLDLL